MQFCMYKTAVVVLMVHETNDTVHGESRKLAMPSFIAARYGGLHNKYVIR